MKKRYMILVLAGMLLATTTGCGSKVVESAEKVTASVSTSVTKDEEKEAISVASFEGKQPDEASIKDVITGLTDRKVKQDAKDVSFLSGILFDGDIVKNVTVDDSAVDVTKEGTYVVIYRITVDPEKLGAYEKTSFRGKVDSTIEVKRQVIILSKEEAVKYADAGEAVYDTGMQLVPRFDGTAVKLPEREIPKSCQEKGTDPIDAASGKPMEKAPKKEVTPTKQAEKKEASKEEKKAEERTTKTASSESKVSSNVTTSSAKKSGKGHYETRTVTDRAAWTETVVDKEGYNERVAAGTKMVVDEPEWDENTPYYVYICGCGAEFSSAAELFAHMEANNLDVPHDTSGVVTRYNTVHHPAVTHEEPEYKDIWHPAVTHTVNHPAQTHTEKVWVEE